MGLPGCLFVCHLILLLVCFLFKGKKEDGKHRQIIARLYSREVKNSLVFGGKRKGENGRNLIQEDFIKEDYENRKKALPLMRAAFSEGKKCKFVNGQLIIGGQRITVH